MQEQQQGGYSSLPFYQRGEQFSIFATDPNEIIEYIKHILRGEAYDPDSNTWKRGDVTLINEKGINAMETILRLNINKVGFLSDLDENDILVMVRCIHIDLVDLFYECYNKFEIKFENLNFIVTGITHFVYMALKKAEEHLTVDMFTKTHGSKEMTIVSDQGSGGGFTNWLTGKGGKK